MAAYYINSIQLFVTDDTDKIVGILTGKAGEAGFYQQVHSQTKAWKLQIEILKTAFKKILLNTPHANSWGILLEYEIVRRSKRIDAVILNDNILVLEFKIGSDKYSYDAEEQLIDYCLDLRDFHFETRERKIFPILVASNATDLTSQPLKSEDNIHPIQYSNKDNLGTTILNSTSEESQIDYNIWDNSTYSPTPTIIEAAQALFAGKGVAEISRSHAGIKNLTKTTDAVIRAIDEAKERNEKIICFITGVPGAGKTLAGLNIAHYIDYQNDEGSLATFLSGNGPLIKVLRAALSRDAKTRLKKEGKETTEKEQNRIIAFIENVHRFLDGYFLKKGETPNNKIVIFDEAQRAWNAEQSKRKFDRDYSEPEMLFEIMERHEDWAVIVALVGGGQEINTGEAGLPEWGRILREKHKNWRVHISSELKEGHHSTGNLTLFEKAPSDITIIENPDLHLNVSIRSYKAEKLSKWVSLVLDNNSVEAKQVLQEHLRDYKIVITRDIGKAKSWLRKKCKGSRRMGLVASSGARRLRPYGIEVKLELEESNWFLNPRDDVRSSYFLEIPATEFGIQGLELDWVGVCWDADLRRNSDVWGHMRFRGTKWQQVNKEEERNFLVNKYRVLLTRARQGMVIWVPEGNSKDAITPPNEYDEIFQYLLSCGLEEV